MKYLCRTLLLILSGALIVTPLFGVYPRRWVDSSYADFVEGTLEGVSLTSDGRLVPAPGLEEMFDPARAFLLSLAIDGQGRPIVGAGDEGKVYRVSAGQGSELATLSEPGVYAVAAAGQELYAATSPDGKVYRLAAGGSAEVYFDPEDKYIWALTADTAGALYVATGPRGIIYRVAPGGNGSVFFDSSQTHIVSLAWDVEGNLLAGSAPGGLLYRLDRDGAPFVLLDSDLEELRTIAVDRIGQIFGGAIAGGAARTTAEPEPPAASTGQGDDTEESRVETTPRGEGSRSAIYRISRDNLVEKIYAGEEIVFDLLARPDGKLLVATGNRGRILVLDPGGFTTVLSDTGEEQVTGLAESGDSVVAITSNLGKVLRLQPRSDTPGEFRSRVLDAEVTARWGQIEWSASSGLDSISVSTRSGNTSEPDDTWSDWSQPYANASGSAVASPAARFLQYRAQFPPSSRTGSLTAREGFVDRVVVSYLQHNLAPVIEQVTVHTPGVAFITLRQANQTGGITPGGPEGAHLQVLPPQIRDLENPRMVPPPRKAYLPGARSFSWAASDENGDELTYTLHIRPHGEESWILLVEDLADAYYTLDGASFPDGMYTLRVTASDAPTNPPDIARQTSLVSRTFVVANSGPTIEWNRSESSGSDATLSFTARSRGTRIFQAEYSLDGKNWIILFPEDGIADSGLETYRFTLPGAGTGPALVRVRVSDTAGNLASSALNID